MAGINEDPDRQVVPRWRHFDAARIHGELASVKPAVEGHCAGATLTELRKDWEENPALFVATDFVSTAFALGRFDVAIDAARAILDNERTPQTSKEVAELYLRRGEGPEHRATPSDEQGGDKAGASANQGDFEWRLRSGVHNARLRLTAYPNNPMLWSNLALLYTTLGLNEKAGKAIKIAIELAPNNRFVLRSASRFYLHEGAKDKAHKLLFNSSVLRSDPWVLAAEIATAAAIGRTSKNIRLARNLLDGGRLPPGHISELASALGTLESKNGNLRAAKPLIEMSLRQPAENAIAQAAFLHRQVGGIGISGGNTQSSEANAWAATCATNWTAALEYSLKWQADQPFSSRPARVASHIASAMLDKYQEGAAIARLSLRSNPGDFNLLNILAFSLAKSDDVDSALRVYRQVDVENLDHKQRVVWLATWGLIGFRAGDYESGRHLYKLAIELGARLRDSREAIARLYFAFEELRIGSPNAEMLRAEALAGAAIITDPSLLFVVKRLRDYVPSPPGPNPPSFRIRIGQHMFNSIQ